MYRLMQSTSVMPVVLTAAPTREERGVHQAHLEKVDSLCFLQAQANKGPAAFVVQQYERNGHPNRREEWRDLERIYGGREADEWLMHPSALGGRSPDIMCYSAEDLFFELIVKLNAIRSEFEILSVK